MSLVTLGDVYYINRSHSPTKRLLGFNYRFGVLTVDDFRRTDVCRRYPFTNEGKETEDFEPTLRFNLRTTLGLFVSRIRKSEMLWTL